MTSTDDPERMLALSYADAVDRPALSALLALDDALAALLRTTTEPAIAQIRLAWWRERLAELDMVVTPAMPVLADLATHVVPRGIATDRLVEIVEGWEILVEVERLDRVALSVFAEKRGAGLFAIGGHLLGGRADRVAGEGWALADLTAHLSVRDEAALARGMAQEKLGAGERWPRETRALGALVTISRMDLALALGATPPVGSPRRVARLAWMRLTGR